MEAAVGLFLESGGAWSTTSIDPQSRNTENSNTHHTTVNTQTLFEDGSGRHGESPVMMDSDVEDDLDFPVSAVSTARSQLPINPETGVRDPITRRRDILVPHEHDLFQQHFTSFPSAIPAANDPFGRFEAGRGNFSSSSTAAGSSSDDSNRLARLFAPPRDIMFTGGGFDDAREYAKKHQRWIIVTLHDPTEFPCQVLNRDLWKDEGVKQLIRASFVFLQFVIETPEGQRYKTFYQVDSLPHIAIIDPRTGERVKQWHYGPEPAEFVVDLIDFIESNSLEPKQKGQKKQRTATDLSEEEQLAAAIQASIETPVTIPGEPIIISDEDEAVPEAGSVSDKIVPRERAEIPAGTADTTSIQFRLPDGKRIMRKFLKSDSVRTLFEHIKFAAPDLQAKPFELMFHRDSLSNKLDETLADLNLVAVALNVDFL